MTLPIQRRAMSALAVRKHRRPSQISFMMRAALALCLAWAHISRALLACARIKKKKKKNPLHSEIILWLDDKQNQKGNSPLVSGESPSVSQHGQRTISEEK
jgi:hypothetical protein